jgi:hypothetical protein
VSHIPTTRKNETFGSGSDFIFEIAAMVVGTAVSNRDRQHIFHMHVRFQISASDIHDLLFRGTELNLAYLKRICHKLHNRIFRTSPAGGVLTKGDYLSNCPRFLQFLIYRASGKPKVFSRSRTLTISEELS